MLLVSILAACVCLAQSPPPSMTPAPAPNQKRQPKQQPQGPQANDPSGGRNYKALKRQQMTDPPTSGQTPVPIQVQTPQPNSRKGNPRHDGKGQRGGGHHNNPNPNKPVPPSYWQVFKKHKNERHDRNWWKQHYTIIVLVGGGYYYYDAGYWFPAWGYDVSSEYYDYDGPIYTYGNLLPDQVIANVQRALKELGYYDGEITGSLKTATREAIAAFQEDYGLEITGVVDAATVAALGLE